MRSCGWKRLIHKISSHLSQQIISLVTSYLSSRTFHVHHGDSISPVHPIQAGVPQGSVLGPLLYLLNTADLPVAHDITAATFADDTAILASSENYEVAVSKLQQSLNKVSAWAKKGKIRLNNVKSNRIDFALRPSGYTPAYLDGQSLPKTDRVRYLGIQIDTKLTWHAHITTKREELWLCFRKMYWLLQTI